VRFIIYHTPFDRLYFYGDDLPVHVSVGPANNRKISRMLPKVGGLYPVSAEPTFFDAA
jgi:hypothetical protein